MAKNFWTLEKLSALEPAKLEQVRTNSIRGGEVELQRQIEELQASRKQRRAAGAGDGPVIGFHFICPDDYEVELLPDGHFWSGVWAVDHAHCDPVIQMRGYLALHKSRRHPSHRQGTVVGWRLEGRSKGAKQVGVSFLVHPFVEAQVWFGGGSGEKGYRRADDLPQWTPR